MYENAGRTSVIALHQRAQSEGYFSPLGLLPPTESSDTIGTAIECSRLDLAPAGFARWFILFAESPAAM